MWACPCCLSPGDTCRAAFSCLPLATCHLPHSTCNLQQGPWHFRCLGTRLLEAKLLTISCHFLHFLVHCFQFFTSAFLYFLYICFAFPFLRLPPSSVRRPYRVRRCGTYRQWRNDDGQRRQPSDFGQGRIKLSCCSSPNKSHASRQSTKEREREGERASIIINKSSLS